MQSELARARLIVADIAAPQDCPLRDKYLAGKCDGSLAVQSALTALRAQQPSASGGVEDVLRGAAVARDRLAPLMKYGEDAVWRPAQFAYEILGNCARTLPTYAQGRKDGIEEAAEIAEQFSTSKWDDRNAIAAAIRALGEPRS